MQITNIFTLLLSASLTTAFYIPPRPLAPRLVDAHRGLHSRQVVRDVSRDVDPVSPFFNTDGSSIPGPVYGFPGDLVDPNTQAPAPAVPEVETPPVDTPILGPQDTADTYVPVSNEPDSALESVEPQPEIMPAHVEQAPAPIVEAPSPIVPEAPTPTPAAELPQVGTDGNGNKVHVEYEYATRWSTEVVYVTVSP